MGDVSNMDSNPICLLRTVISQACAQSPHVLHALQQQFLHISDAAVNEVAGQLGILAGDTRQI